MQNIEEYILKTREERRKHLKLDIACDERGLRYSYNLIGLLAYILDTTIPDKNLRAYVCHACNNSICSNPWHLYWGTPKDNIEDQILAGTHQSVYQRTVSKYGKLSTKSISAENGKKDGKNNKDRKKSDIHKEKISESLRGRKFSEETRQKMKESANKRWKNKSIGGESVGSDTTL